MDRTILVTIPAAARNLIALFLLVTGFQEIAGTAHGMDVALVVPLHIPPFFPFLIACLKLCGGVLLVIGWKTRATALLLAMLTLTGLLPGLTMPAPQLNVHLFKDLAIAGGLLQIVSFGGGEYSVDIDSTSVAG